MRRAGEFIATVGSPSGRSIYVVWTRAALGICRQVARVRTFLLTVPPVVAACVRTQSSHVRMIGLHTHPNSKRVLSGPLIRSDFNGDCPDAPHWNTSKTEKNLQRSNFRTRMYNQLITQSESISKTKQRYKWELRFQLAQIIFLIIENSNRQLNLCNACVCVKTEPTRFEKSWQEQPDFLKKRENPWQISQKSNLTLSRA
jgi:hypothetical protein